VFDRRNYIYDRAEQHRPAKKRFSRASQFRVKLGIKRSPISVMSAIPVAMPIRLPSSADPF
jgi:hypothetical protein